MHRGLLIPEVVELICGVADFPTLSSLARTCQTFQPPALAVLWETQFGLMQLLKCMPSDLWKVVPAQDGKASVNIQRPIVPADLTRMLFYAEYVRTFIQEDRQSTKLEPYAALSIPSAGSKLWSIILDLWGSQVVRSTLFPYLTAFHPNLTRVAIEFGIMDAPVVEEAAYSALRSLNRLERVKINCLDGPTLLHLMLSTTCGCVCNITTTGLPNLNCLHIHYFPDLHLDFRPPVFTALHQFIAYCESMKLITNFFNALESDALNKIELTIKSTAVAKEWPWVSYNHEIPDVLELMLPADSFHPLLSCVNLTEVHIVIGHAGLMPLAQHCSHLETLALVLDATSINPYAKEKPRAGVCNLTLLKLDVVELPVDSPAAVASFLSAIFLNLWKVSSCKDGEWNILMPDGEENMVEWASVGALVRVILSARAQEHYFPGTMLVDGE
ncbi:hypothetical protein DFH08DRAFT_855000 [Mycena albidolilacea]|uniref:F-box domain-containing protein n=1 Tax=Mycena albidolilacea TaxID=1033008 RepID=A0AAD7EWZ5_9AGAR|nr:hypothetical protein DFH08DRAFT_855000 [Mycena albidolilacea]